MTSDPAAIIARLVLTNLTDGKAAPGDMLEAVLSDGTPIDTYAWGSSPGSNDFGAEATLIVPEIAAGTLVYVTLQAQTGTFTAKVSITPSAVTSTTVRAGTGTIDIADLAPLPAQSGLILSAGPSLITVETA
jgi:hypothetical protein